jgi:mono/diheme cytochrome c family protein
MAQARRSVMKRIVLWRSVFAASLAALLTLGGTAVAQFRIRPEEVKIDVSSYPADIQTGYRVFANKCSECHSLASSLKQSRSTEGWLAEVHRMQAMASSHVNNREADEIAKFLTYDEIHRKAALRETASTNSSRSPEAAGKQLLESYGCSSCHSVAGVGNTSSPLDGIGNKRTAEELRKVIASPPSGSTMPAMDVPEHDLNILVAYLVRMKNN